MSIKLNALSDNQAKILTKLLSSEGSFLASGDYLSDQEVDDLLDINYLLSQLGAKTIISPEASFKKAA